jgi:hypothetical protein
MIDLDHTKEQMLAEINASEKTLANCLSDPADPLFASLDEARLVVRGQTPDNLLPILNGALAKRFAGIPSEQLARDLIYPLKKGLGNAYKWGNQKDPVKHITVETVATRTGAVVAISDEGEGFEVNGILRRFHGDEHYFTHGGSGFVYFNRAKSLISYADGGRTLLIRFLCAQAPATALMAKKSSAFGLAGDEEFMKSFLAAELPWFQKNKATLASCRICVPDDQTGDQPELQYVLEYRRHKSEKVSKITLSGRLLPEHAAEIDFAVARQLYVRLLIGETGILIPRPVAVLKHPSLVLFKFNPSMGLQSYLEKEFDFQEVRKIIQMVAKSLRAWHHSMIALPCDAALEGTLEEHRSAGETAMSRLAQAKPQLAERVQHIYDQLAARVATLKSYERVPIHGALEWRSILYGDGRFYFYRFEKCRRSHPGFDLGGFLADLLRFYVLRKKADPEFYYAGREVFLETYFAGTPAPWHEDLSFFMTDALLLRLPSVLEQTGKKWEAAVDALLRRCEQAL